MGKEWSCEFRGISGLILVIILVLSTPAVHSQALRDDSFAHVFGVQTAYGLNFTGEVTGSVFDQYGNEQEFDTRWNDVFDKTLQFGVVLGRRFTNSRMWMFLNISHYSWYPEKEIDIGSLGTFNLESSPTIKMWKYTFSLRYFVIPTSSSQIKLHFGPFASVLTEGFFGGSGLFSGGVMAGAHYSPLFFGSQRSPLVLNLDISLDLTSEDDIPRVLDVGLSVLVGMN